MDDRLFRDAMGKFATGITIVSIDYGGEILGMTVNAFMSVSLDPKLIAISIDEKASMYNKLQETKKFGVSILAEEQKDISMIFAKQKEKDREIPFIRLDDIPVIKDSIATLSCHVKETTKAGDHMIFIAEVTGLTMSEKNPTLFFGGKYRTMTSL
ncbi:flavin reductase family protein [Virgibacillus alimentarius]|uniref:Flavin reductase (DIM6/NTAB) family NADH-FMN oxidoreductase RutF n=1 Tax=Virgibacillus alimentarius TaxID=698769 RepID=A0ABS4S5Y4_9BACI|nr:MULTISPECIES: flavin reductase family protein [Virgibacillus]MBP2256309.1 flavin reductase (DIM6/NTAB) family NADH-FMN oxidoreductase RutF [Virgibacillus alimentarius]HLR66255.1 flavin reductase family protein [Virgibacillus sp.]